VIDAGSTFLAPIFDELTAVVCLSGTPVSHIDREPRVPGPLHHGRHAGRRARRR
jgi:hypothetical protein